MAVIGISLVFRIGGKWGDDVWRFVTGRPPRPTEAEVLRDRLAQQEAANLEAQRKAARTDVVAVQDALREFDGVAVLDASLGVRGSMPQITVTGSAPTEAVLGQVRDRVQRVNVSTPVQFLAVVVRR